VQPDDKAFISRFEVEGEEQVRHKIATGGYSSARQYHTADLWLKQKTDAREARSEAERLLSERQTQAAESANQLGERQIREAETANQLARDAIRRSNWAILISIVGCIVAAVAILYDHA